MCIIIDTNVLASVFVSSSAYHTDFKPVKDWIFEGKGKIVFGGSKYQNEINGKYLSLFLELKKAGKAVYIDSVKVDNEEKIVTTLVVDPDFDDQHLVGLLRVSGCKLICSEDARAFPFFRHPIFFKTKGKKPKIYSNKANAKLLVDKNIACICKPSAKTTNKQKEILKGL